MTPSIPRVPASIVGKLHQPRAVLSSAAAGQPTPEHLAASTAEGQGGDWRTRWALGMDNHAMVKMLPVAGGGPAVSDSALSHQAHTSKKDPKRFTGVVLSRWWPASLKKPWEPWVNVIS